MSPPALDSIKESTDKAERFVEWIAGVWRSKNCLRKLLLLDVVLCLTINPFSLLEILKWLPWPLALPAWYPLVFWLIVGLIFAAAIVVAVRTRPTGPSPEPPESKALKGLRPFGFEDAEVFARLQRENGLRECLQAVTVRDFRFGILVGESGCGKSSFLQAGLWPRLLRQNHQCFYVKFTDLDPLDSVRQAVAEMPQLSPEQSAGLDLSALLATAAPAGSPPLVLLFDQFEQFFVHRQHKQKREAFVQALAEWYKSRQPPLVKILICLREDFYGRMIELQKSMGAALLGRRFGRHAASLKDWLAIRERWLRSCSWAL